MVFQLNDYCRPTYIATALIALFVPLLYVKIIVPLMTFSPLSVMARINDVDNGEIFGLFPLCGNSLKKIAESPVRTSRKGIPVENGDAGTTSCHASHSSTEQGGSKRNLQPKTVYLIRHAESNENRRLESLARSIRYVKKLSIPAKEDIVASVELLDIKAQLDSDVSEVGKRQIAELAMQLARSNFLEESRIQLVAHSPLRRARQTSEGMLGCVSPRLVPSTDSVVSEVDAMPLRFVDSPCVPIPTLPNIQSSGHGPHGTLPVEEYNSPGQKAPSVSRIVELPCLMERTPMEWLNPAALDSRIAEFEEWLYSIPEERIAVVGHSQYFKTMLGLNYKFKNCDVWHLTYTPTSSESCKDSKNPRRIKSNISIAEGAGSGKANTTHAVQEQMSNILSLGRINTFSSFSKSWSDCDSASEQPVQEGEENVDLLRGWSGLKLLYRYNPDGEHSASF